jgi:hypothetical protein
LGRLTAASSSARTSGRLPRSGPAGGSEKRQPKGRARSPAWSDPIVCRWSGVRCISLLLCRRMSRPNGRGANPVGSRRM